MPIQLHHIKSKLATTYVLENTENTKPFVPDTALLCKKSFERMIFEHNILYIKPDGGRKSKGIFRIDRLKEQFILRHSETSNIRKYTNTSSLWNDVYNLTKRKKYVIQQGVDSNTSDNRPFDLRCHAVRIKGKWVVAGICARIGKQNGIVTTNYKGGNPTVIENLFTNYLHLSEEEQDELVKKLHFCILSTVNTISPLYPLNKEFAVDIGIDSNKNVWIYEVNIEPLIRRNFKLLDDKSIYERIRRLRSQAE
ncbi:YheC/YheD family protein [Evansella sp. AB-rgal1]|uniref:YheC/YheD family protein n=1 Tax=Evansella sp. AB-rgal1 TaxID=3242696 RepID=UPI00359D586C